MPKKMDIKTLQAMLASEKASAMAAVVASKLSGERTDAQMYYLGNMDKDMPAEDGRSRVVSMDVMEAIEGIMPSMMEIFGSGDQVVRFDPVGPEDEEAADQETDYINHVFMNQNPGWLILYSFIKDALLSKVGVVKVWWEENEREETETYYDLTDEQYALLAYTVAQSDGAMEIVEHTEKPEGMVMQ